jgi:hypothetical protein
LALGESQALDHGANLTARLEQIELYPRDDGSLQRFTSQLSLSHQSQPTKTLTVSPGAAPATTAIRSTRQAMAQRRASARAIYKGARSS